MEDKKRLTGLQKRQQIAKANKTMFIWVAVAAVVISFCVIALQFMFKQALFNGKVISAKSQAASTLQQNIQNASGLQTNVNALLGNPSLGSVKLDSEDSNLEVVLDALPTRGDTAALAASLQRAVLNKSGVFIENLTVPNNAEALDPEAEVDPTTLLPEPQEQPFNLVIQGSYNQITNALRDMERVIRPLNVLNISFQGGDNSLRATIDGVTYFQPAKSVNIQKKTIKP